MCNPNFSPEVKRLIQQRDALKHATPHPLTLETVNEITALNTDISSLINTIKKQNWATFLETLKHSSNISKLYRTLNSITLSHTNTPQSHESITNTDNLPTDRQQANILVDHFASISHLGPERNDRKTMRRKLQFPLDHNSNPFTTQQTQHILNNIKNSKALGPDNISNLHLKHLGAHGVQALTNISNYSYAHNVIPNIWKQGIIITILKPRKDATLPSSYRPISLLCTPSKITERLILTLLHNHIPLAPTQHGFRPLHSTNTLLTDLTQHVYEGINSKIPPQRSLLITLDISKAFDAIPRFRLTEKLYDSGALNNTKRWVANYLSGRFSYVCCNGKKSRMRGFPNGVPQGSVLSPTLFNLYMHDLPAPPSPNIRIATYADDLTITSTHNNIEIGAQQVQPYLNTLHDWFSTNRLKIAPSKSTVTLLTSDTKEHRHVPLLNMNDVDIEHHPSKNVLGVTYDTSMSFKDHTLDVKQRCTPRLNALRLSPGPTSATKRRLLRWSINNSSDRLSIMPARHGTLT